MNNRQYDYLIVGSGLFGAVLANCIKSYGKKVLILEKRNHIGGNVYTENMDGIHVHRYGAHIFHTNKKNIWDYVNAFSHFNRFTNSPIANYNGELYSLPFNMYTFNKMWGVNTPDEAKEIIEKQKKELGIKTPSNLEEQAISLVGFDIYNKLVKGYTEKQWGRKCSALPSFIIKRLPVRFTYDNNYFNALYQGIPENGYTDLIKNLLQGVEIRTNTDYLTNRSLFNDLADCIIYTGPIDAYFDYRLGNLEYRSLRFETECLKISNFQGNAVINYTDTKTPWTRIIEHKWFNFGKNVNGDDIDSHTVITKEYPIEWQPGYEPYYPVNDEKNNSLYMKYRDLANAESKVIFAGRLGEYKYYDMDAVVEKALCLFEVLRLK